SSMEVSAIWRDLIFSYIAKKIFAKKVILHIHGGLYLMNPPKKKQLFYLIKKLFDFSDAIILLSVQEKEILCNHYGDYNFIIFPNAVDTILLKEPKKVEDNRINFIFLGSINKAKGIFI